VRIEWLQTFCLCVWKNETAEVITTEAGDRSQQCIVAYTDEEIVLGKAAAQHAGVAPQHTLHSALELMAVAADQPAGAQLDGKEALSARFPQYAFTWDKTASGAARLSIAVKHKGKPMQVTPDALVVQLLTALRTTAQNYVGEPIEKAVFTVPVYYSSLQREALIKAADAAGLTVLRLLDQPAAAMLAYDLDVCPSSNTQKNSNSESKSTSAQQKKVKSTTVCVCDFGGSEFNVSIARSQNGVIAVDASVRDATVGGNALDDALYAYVEKYCKRVHSMDFATDLRAQFRLREACHHVKHVLSASHEGTIDIDTLADGKDLLTKVSRARFQSLCSKAFKQILRCIETAIARAGLATSDIDGVIFSGGACSIPALQKAIKALLPDATSYDAINPSEVGASGAALQAAILCGFSAKQLEDRAVLNAVQRTLAIETAGGVVRPVLPRGTLLPCTVTRSFKLVPGQTSVRCALFEGEQPLAKDNKALGVTRFETTAGKSSIALTFAIDANGVLTVKSSSSGTASLTIKSASDSKEAKTITTSAAVLAEQRALANKLVGVQKTLGRFFAQAPQAKKLCNDVALWLAQQTSATATSAYAAQTARVAEAETLLVAARSAAQSAMDAQDDGLDDDMDFGDSSDDDSSDDDDDDDAGSDLD
jgi:molecular chaperone DnaK (HSP70)